MTTVPLELKAGVVRVATPLVGVTGEPRAIPFAVNCTVPVIAGDPDGVVMLRVATVLPPTEMEFGLRVSIPLEESRGSMVRVTFAVMLCEAESVITTLK